jgi:hypothetical protein
MNEIQLHQPNFKFEYDSNDAVAVKAIAEATAKIIRPGIYTNIPEDIYHAMPLPSAHKLWTMRKLSPYHFWDKYLNPKREVEKYESTALLFGKAFHLLVLEPMAAIEKIRQSPELNLRTKDGRTQLDEFKKSLPAGAIVLQPDDYERLMLMGNQFFKNEKNKTYFKNHAEGLNEVTIIWDEDGVKMRGRIDRVANGMLHDLKTANDVNRYAFGESANRYGYAWQLMIYQRGWYKLTGEVLNPLITAVESDRPYQTKHFIVGDAQFEREAEIFEKIISIYKYCVANDHWFGYNSEPEFLFTRANYFDERQWFDDILQRTTLIEPKTNKGVGHEQYC